MIALYGPRCQGKWGEIARRSCGRGRPDLQEALGVETSAAFAERRQWGRHSVGAAALRGSRGLLGKHEAKESRKACLYLLLGRSTPSKTHYTRMNRPRFGCTAGSLVHEIVRCIRFRWRGASTVSRGGCTHRPEWVLPWGDLLSERRAGSPTADRANHPVAGSMREGIRLTLFSFGRRMAGEMERWIPHGLRCRGACRP
jgi:hypothetical protein